MRVNSNKQSLFESFMDDISNSKTLQGENVDKFLNKYNSIYGDLPIVKNGKLYVDNIRLRGSGISKGIEATLENGIMEVYNEEWGFKYDGNTVSNVEEMSQYWFSDDYENNEEFHNKIDSAARSLYNDLTALVSSTLTESDEIDHLIQRGSVYIPVRKGQRDDKVLNHLETLGGMNDVPPTEEELASGKYRPVAKYVYANGNGGLMTGEYEKIEDEELTEEDGSDATDINWLFTDYEYPPDLSTYEDFKNGGDSSYFTILKSVHDAEKFNYHSDHWGSADGYQQDAIDIMSTLEPLIDKKVIVDIDEGESATFKLVGVALDRQYNSVSHMKILVEEIGSKE